MSLTLRIRYSEGAFTLNISESSTLVELHKQISARTGLNTSEQQLKVGIPPKPLADPATSASLAKVGIHDRDTIIVERRKDPAAAGLGHDATSQANKSVGSERLPSESAREAKKRFLKEAMQAKGSSSSSRGSEDLPESELLPAFDRAIAAATEHVKNVPEDKHQVWALRRGKKAVIESLKEGNNISLGALHTLTGVGHWVVQEVKRHMTEDIEPPSKRQSRNPSSNARSVAPPTPQSFTWWYLNRDGKYAAERNSADFSGSFGSEQFRVCILHSSGRMEKAWLPDAKAPPRCPASQAEASAAMP